MMNTLWAWLLAALWAKLTGQPNSKTTRRGAMTPM